MMDVILPDLTIFIRIPPELAAGRKYKDKELLDRHEKDTTLLRKVNSMYDKIKGENMLSEEWIEIDGSKDLKSVKNNVEIIIHRLLENREE